MIISNRNTMPLRYPSAFSAWVRGLRQTRQLTQSELAEKAGVTQRLISDFERGKVDIRLDTLCRIFRALDVCLAGIDETIRDPNDVEPEW